LPLATTLARKSGATVHLVHTVPPLATVVAETPFYVDLSLENQLRDHQFAVHRTYLDDAANRVREKGKVAVQSSLLDGEPGPSIRAYAETVNADLVLATTHGRGAVARFWLGSVTDDLIRHAKEPLLLVHPKEGEADFTTDVPLKRILVAMDGTTLAEQILAPAAQVAQASGATLLLLRVVKPVYVASYPALEAAALTREVEGLMTQVRALQTQLEQEASRYLETKAIDLRKQGLTVETRVDVAETPATAILEEAKGAEIVAMETHGRSGLTRFFMGSVTDKVVRASTAAVLVQHPAGE
jgi:nucleotide-binding universal stress UspA family protein